MSSDMVQIVISGTGQWDILCLEANMQMLRQFAGRLEYPVAQSPSSR